MNWHPAIWVFAIWVTGWILVIFLTWAAGHLYHRARFDKSKREDSMIRLLILFVAWPVMFGPVWHNFRYYFEVRMGKHPSWILYGEGEESSRGWTLSDGTRFSASTGSGDSGASVNGYYESDVSSGSVQYRLRRTAPTKEPWPDVWQEMVFRPPTKAELKFDAETQAFEEELDDGDSWPSFAAEFVLDPGKYAIALRVHNGSGNFEECSELTLIVGD